VQANFVEKTYARAAEGVVWSYFLEGAYAEAVNAAKQYQPAKEYVSANPLLLSYFSMLRLGRRAAAESLLKEETAKFTGVAEEHLLLLEAQERVSEGFRHSDPKSKGLGAV